MYRFRPIFSAWIMIAVVLTGAFTARGQQKKRLDHDAYDIWNRITASALSNDGAWTLWTLGPEERDDTLHIRALNGAQTYTIARGADARFTNDSRYAVYRIKAPADSVRQAKKDKKKPEEMPKDGLGIMTLSSGEMVQVERVKSFKLPKEGSGWVAHLLEKETVKEDTTASEENKDRNKSDKEEGTGLILRNRSCAKARPASRGAGG